MARAHEPASLDFRKQTYIVWLLTPREDRPEGQRTQEDFGDHIGVTQRTLNNWKNDPDFLREWERTYLKTIGSPEVKSRIMQTLLATATDGDDPKHVQAAKAYFEIEGSMKPHKTTVEVTRPATELTDDELDEILAHKIADQKAG